MAREALQARASFNYYLTSVDQFSLGLYGHCSLIPSGMRSSSIPSCILVRPKFFLQGCMIGARQASADCAKGTVSCTLSPTCPEDVRYGRLQRPCVVGGQRKFHCTVFAQSGAPASSTGGGKPRFWLKGAPPASREASSLRIIGRCSWNKRLSGETPKS